MNNKQHILLLEKLMQHTFSQKQYEILESFRNTLRRRKLSDKQKEIANGIYLQLRGITIKNESIELSKNLHGLNDIYIEPFLDTFIEQNPLPEKDIKSIIKSVIYYCDDYDLKIRIMRLYESKFS